jgi:hypothetical protein
LSISVINKISSLAVSMSGNPFSVAVSMSIEKHLIIDWHGKK